MPVCSFQLSQKKAIKFEITLLLPLLQLWLPWLFRWCQASYFGNGQALKHQHISWIPGISAGVFIDPLSVLFTCLIAFFGLIIAVYSWGYMKGEEGLTRYYFLLMLFIGSMIGLVISDNMLQMFIFWEMVGLCSYALIAFWYKRPESINAGVKVFIMTRIGDISLLAAIGILYAGPLINGQAIGSFSFRAVIQHLQQRASAGTLNTELLVVVFFLVLGGAIAKSAQLPLFTWLYSAMEAPTSVSALLHAATMVKAGVYLLARFILIASVATPLIAALRNPVLVCNGCLDRCLNSACRRNTGHNYNRHQRSSCLLHC